MVEGRRANKLENKLKNTEITESKTGGSLMISM